MLSVTKLARSCGISRSTLLYYESAGLLRATRRTAAGYRQYSAKDAERLRQICDFRAAGLGIEDIREMLRHPATPQGAGEILERRLQAITREIAQLREHQQSILKLMQASQRRQTAVSKDKWVEIMRAAGLNDADMKRWHAVFEAKAPQDHENFLKFLEIGPDEIIRIRQWSRDPQ